MTVYEGTESTHEGKTIHYFERDEQFINPIGNTFKGFDNLRPLRIETYEGAGLQAKLKYKKEFGYSYFDLGDIEIGAYITPLYCDPDINMYPYYDTEQKAAYYWWLDKHVFAKKARKSESLLTIITETHIEGANSIITSTNFVYDQQRRVAAPLQVKVNNSNDIEYTTTFTYPFQNSGSVYTGMIGRNYISPVITKTISTTAGGNKFEKYEYKTLGNDYMIGSIYLGTSTAPTLTTNFGMHDPYGNPVYVADANGNGTIYLWSYKGQYPVAAISATLNDVSQIQSIIGTTIDNLSRASNPDSYQLASLRNYFLTSIYRYKPHVGMIESTDPSGRITKYNYDSSGRLVEVRDTDNNIVKQYIYQQ